jgi:hypothetical protein
MDMMTGMNFLSDGLDLQDFPKDRLSLLTLGTGRGEDDKVVR